MPNKPMIGLYTGVGTAIVVSLLLTILKSHDKSIGDGIYIWAIVIGLIVGGSTVAVIKSTEKFENEDDKEEELFKSCKSCSN